MSNDKIDPSNKDATISSTDDVTKTANKSDAELSEEQLKRVSGGFVTFDLTQSLTTSHTVSGSGGDPPPQK